MSGQDQLEVVKQWFRALADGQFYKLHQFHTDDIVWELMPGPAEMMVPWAGIFHGREGVEDCLTRYGGVVRSEAFVIDEPLVGPDDTVAVPGYSDYVAVANGQRFRIEFVELFHFRDDKIAFVKVYADTAPACEALK